MRIRRVLAAAGVTVAVLGVGGGAEASPPTSVSGGGMVTLPASFGDLAGDSVVFQVHGRGEGPQARGRFQVLHLDDAGGVYAHASGDITCMTVAGGTATVTGVIRQAWFRDFPGWDVTGTAAAITVADAGLEDVIGFDFEFFGSTITPCGEVPPFVPVERGNFVIR